MLQLDIKYFCYVVSLRYFERRENNKNYFYYYSKFIAHIKANRMRNIVWRLIYDKHDIFFENNVKFSKHTERIKSVCNLYVLLKFSEDNEIEIKLKN